MVDQKQTARSRRHRRAAAGCGLVAPAVAAVTIVAATLIDPTFSWATSALSDLGALPEGESVTVGFLLSSPEFLLFNGGLIAAGVAGLPFAWILWVAAVHPLQRVAAAAVAMAVIALALVGVLHVPRPHHGTVAITHFAAATVALWTYGSGSVLAGRPARGLATIWLGIAHLLFWIIWSVTLRPGPIPGLAVPETVGALLFGGWTAATARSFLGWPPVPEPVAAVLDA